MKERGREEERGRRKDGSVGTEKGRGKIKYWNMGC